LIRARLTCSHMASYIKPLILWPLALVSSNQRRRSEISVSYSTKNSAWLNTSRKWRHHASIFCRTGIGRSAGPLNRSFEAWLRQLSFSQSAKVGDHAASTRSERSSAVDSRPTDERTRDTSSEAAPLVTRRPSSGLQIEHHDALNPHWSVSNVFFQNIACRRRHPDEVRSATRRHRSIHWAALSHWNRQENNNIISPERSSSVTPLYHWLETFKETYTNTLF